jgi:hypothetical protein
MDSNHLFSFLHPSLQYHYENEDGYEDKDGVDQPCNLCNKPANRFLGHYLLVPCHHLFCKKCVITNGIFRMTCWRRRIIHRYVDCALCGTSYNKFLSTRPSKIRVQLIKKRK